MTGATRTLGNSGIEVSPIGVGCWAIGGPLHAGGEQFGWGAVDDTESTAALHRAFDLGATFFDTASNYGAGHSETVLGRAFAGRRDQVVIATKWGNTFDEATGEATGQDATPGYLRTAIDDSLRRLGTDYVDLYQFHISDAPLSAALDLVDTLEGLVAAGKIRAYAWSTDNPASAEGFAAKAPHCAAVQHDFSVLNPAAGMVAVVESLGLASIARGPLAMGLLSGKYHDGRRVAADDVRSQGHQWIPYFGKDGTGSAEHLSRIDAVREVLTSGGRTLAQGALAWLLARTDAVVPIPGCRTVAQVEENLAVRSPLTPSEFAEVESLLRG
ncbi:aldo/keto reductase [Kitasatospora sp. NPDC048365]|uniref:aldo/keto reductase n=1 Tax=Kitasatospora sp. NPDC048365 TaxID=3364050 RepID=UPI003710B276